MPRKRSAGAGGTGDPADGRRCASGQRPLAGGYGPSFPRPRAFSGPIVIPHVAVDNAALPESGFSVSQSRRSGPRGPRRPGIFSRPFDGCNWSIGRPGRPRRRPGERDPRPAEGGARAASAGHPAEQSRRRRGVVSVDRPGHRRTDAQESYENPTSGPALGVVDRRTTRPYERLRKGRPIRGQTGLLPPKMAGQELARRATCRSRHTSTGRTDSRSTSCSIREQQ